MIKRIFQAPFDDLPEFGNKIKGWFEA